MRNAISFFKHYRPPVGLSRSRNKGWLSCVLAIVTSLALGSVLPAGPSGAASPQSPGVNGQSSASAVNGQSSASPSAAALALPGRPFPRLAAIILPRHAPPGTYRLHVLDAAIEVARAQVMAALAPLARPGDPPGAWIVRQVDPIEAFGDVGTYDRSRLARLYAGKPAHLLRAPLESEGRVVGSVTLISPYPDAELSRLSPGTVAILFVVAAARR